MKKQFFRVKQLADQTFSRAGKTEALSDDLQGAERRIEFIRTVCNNSAKKLANPGVAPDPATREKRLKKNAEYCLGSSMVESASGEEERLLREVVTDCGKLLMCLATTYVEHEIKIESNVVAPLSNISDVDYPNILKQKRNLTKLILDMDSARTRYHTAIKHHNSSSSTGSKIESIKDELEEAETKVEQCRDSLACDMLQLMAREAEVSSVILEYARFQRIYHSAAVAILDEIIPEMETAINESSCRPVFGRPLEEHLQVTGRKIAYPIELCVCALLELGINEEGLFRVTAGASKVRRMKLSFDANCLDLVSALQFKDPHIFTGVLKSYLRELPEPLLTHKLYDQWMAAGRVMSGGSTEDGLNALWNVVKMLPEANLNNLHYLTRFFHSLASNKQSNKMTTQNLAIVIAPNLLWGPSEDPNSIGLNMNTATLQSIIVDTLISYSEWFFPGDIDFYITVTRGSGVLNGHFGEDHPDGLPPTNTIKRTQSNSSLSDQHSPPHGSPKPAVRVRRQKSAAPNPPVNRGEVKSVYKEDIVKDESNEISLNKTKKSPQNEEIKDPRQGETIKEIREKDFDVQLESVKHLTASPVKEQSTTKEIIVNSPEKGRDETAIQKNRPKTMLFDNFESAKEGKREASALDRQTSKSGEDIHKMSPLELYSTLERKKPSGRPVPAPRTTLENKPSIPQRPANLPRPHSSSFRISRNLDDTSPDQGELSSISLERTHMYSVDKQQVAIIQVNNEKPEKIAMERRESGDKPEKPKKPEGLTYSSSPPSVMGHQRAASEGSIIDTSGTDKVIYRGGCVRPTPPPPPTPTKKEPPADECVRTESNPLT